MLLGAWIWTGCTGSSPVDTDTAGERTYTTTEEGTCDGFTADDQGWDALSSLGYVDDWSTSVFVIEDETAWAKKFPNADPAEVGIDFTTHVAAGASWSTGGCDWPSEEVTATVSDGARAHVEITFDFTGVDTMCDMGILAQKVVKVPRHDEVTVCMVQITDRY